MLTAAGCQLGNDSACTSAERPIFGFKKPPRNRLGSRPSMTMVTHYLSLDDLGSHRYNFSLAEKNGMVYTCKAGHIDPQLAQAPGTGFFAEYGFKIKVKVEPREWEKNKILQIVYPDANQRKKYIDPAVHLSTIMDYIHRDAAKRYGPNSFDH